MKKIFLSLATIAAVVGLLLVGNSYQHESERLEGLALVAMIVVVGIAIFYFKLYDNIGSLLWAIGSGWGTYWAGSKTISSIDFEKPFLLSFYWSSVGYALLTLFLLLLCVVMLFLAAQEYDT